nr:2-dehydro-3-deoxyphosphooctonate aldolase [Quercus suber]
MLYSDGNRTLKNGNGTRYGFVQCSRDLNLTECSNCLKVLVNNVSDCCQESTGFRMFNPSCDLSFCVGALKHLQHSQYKTLPLSHSTHFSSQIFRLVAEKIFEIVIWVQMESSALLFNQLKAADPFFLLAGSNVIESEEHIFRMARHIKAIASKVALRLVFKSSFDKANKTSSKSFWGPGMVEGLKILEKVKLAYDIPIVTDVHKTI